MPAARGRRRNRGADDDSDEEERPRQRRHVPDPGSENDQTEGRESGDEVDSDGPSDAQRADDQLAKKLIRYALSCEYARQPIRRDGVKERVLGKKSRSFKRIFDIAQVQLRYAFGMEMQELPVREKMTLQEKRKALSSSTQGRTGSGSYILCSVLPPDFRTPEMLTPSMIPSPEAEATYIGFYTLIVSCICLGGGELSDQKLKRYLSRLNADRNVWADKTELVLKRMEKQGYVISRVERPPVGQDGENTTTWHVGVRAKEEIGVEGVVGIVEEVYGGPSPELEKKLKASLGVKILPRSHWLQVHGLTNGHGNGHVNGDEDEDETGDETGSE